MEKGMSVSIWIWIIGGLVVAIMTFTAAYYNLSQIGEQAFRQNIVDQYEGLNSDIEFICRQATGSSTQRKVKLRKVRAIFASSNRGEPPGDVPQKITDKETNTGNFVCLTFDNAHYGCVEHDCMVEMTYIGMPSPASDMYKLGSADGNFEFELSVEKTDFNTVEVSARHIP